jgi:hypothetical protein
LLQLAAGGKLQQQLQQQHLPLGEMFKTFSKMQLLKIKQLQQHLWNSAAGSRCLSQMERYPGILKRCN